MLHNLVIGGSDFSEDLQFEVIDLLFRIRMDSEDEPDSKIKHVILADLGYF